MSAMHLTLAQAAAWIAGARIEGDAATAVARVHTDTRSLQAGDLFVALKGERFDAAQFLPQAAQQGAVAAVVNADAAPLLRQAGLPGLLVPDARQALGQLAAGWRRQFRLPLVAVTGSNGKTTVTQMVAAILHAWLGEQALATQGNLNNDIGVPLTLLRLRTTHRAAVVELGMNHPGEIAYLAALAQPTAALVNNAQREHQEFMASVQAVAEENGSVLAALPADGTAIFPARDAFAPLWRSLSAAAHTLGFGRADDAGRAGDEGDQDNGADMAVRLRHAAWQGQAWQVQADTPVGEVRFALHLAGRHNLHNALAALACGVAAGAPVAALAQGLSAFRPAPGRSRLLTLPCGARTVTLVDDTYNANPDSVRALIDVLAELPGPRLLALGDMGEVGSQGEAFHAEVGAYARQRGIEHLLTHGPLMAHATAAFAGGEHFNDMAALQAAACAHLARGELASIAVKGSRFMQMERVVQALENEGAKEAPAC